MRSLKSLAIGAAALSFASAAQAQDLHPASDMIASQGLAATEASLAKIADPTDDDLFALGGVRFLRAIEQSLQTRWSMGMSDLPMIPILRLPVPENPNPEAFRPSVVREVFEDVLVDLKSADSALAQIDGDVGMRLNLSALWFDINANGTRDAREGFASAAVGAMATPASTDIVVRFDTADVSWLRAYAHLLSGVSEVVLAFDPTEAIELTQETTAKLGPLPPPYGSDPTMTSMLDQGAATLLALRQQPDTEHSRAALKHFQSMTEHNLTFWAAVNAETDDDAEWIPNPKQTSAFGVQITKEVADAWQDILREGQAILKGDLLIPYWRAADTGLNIRRIFETPTPMDPVMWVQGAGALPYLEKGELANSRNWSQFMRLLGGEAPLYALWFN